MKLSRRVVVAGLPVLLTRGALAQAEPVQIYAAMTFRTALDSVLRAYRNAGGAATAVYGATPALVRQVAMGAPADILLTADPAWMDEAVAKALVRSESRANLVGNELVLAGSTDTPKVDRITRDYALAALIGAGKLAMCDPDRDPAGRYAKESLQSLGLWQGVMAHVAIAETSPAAVRLVQRREVNAAVCFATDLHGVEDVGRVGAFPANSHAPIIYPVALTSATTNPDAPKALAYLRAPQAIQIFVSYGYQTPSS
jgi:molybdate transport system substrate-binding protein